MRRDMKHHLFALLAGLVAACGFEPLGLWPLTLVGFAALMWLIERAPRLRSALALGWWFGVGHFTLGLNWIATAFTHQAAMPAWLGWIAVVALSLYLAVYPAMAAGLAWRYGRRSPLALTLWFAAAWIVTEWLRGTMFTGFAWNPAGVALLPTPVARVSTLVGTYGLSGAVMLLAGLLLLLKDRHWRSAGAVAGGVAAVTALTFLAGPVPPPTRTAMRLVQPNLTQEQRAAPGFYAFSLDRLGSLTNAGQNEPRLVLWPESSIDEPLADERAGGAANADLTRREVASLLGPRDLLLAGAYTIRSADGRRATSGTNSVFAIGGTGRILARYDKAHLVPYGEYLPMRPLLSALGLSRLVPGDVGFDPGPGPQTLDLPFVGKVGFQLCYEIIFSGEVVDRANRPAFLFNPSNDAWFGAWGPPQHLAQARLRGLEEGLPVLRATTNGISAVIDADGRMLQTIPKGEAAFIDTHLPGPRAPTLFARFGNILPILFALLLAAAAIAVGRKAR